MTLRTFFLFEDTVAARARPVYLPRGDRAIYVRAGGIDVVSNSWSQFLWESSALTSQEEVTLIADDRDTVLWRWELAADDTTDEQRFAFRSAPETTSAVKLMATFDFDDRYTWLIRCDMVTFPPGGIALTHL